MQNSADERKRGQKYSSDKQERSDDILFEEKLDDEATEGTRFGGVLFLDAAINGTFYALHCY
jgi:hypothetical protein